MISVACVMGYLNADVSDLKISGVVEDFGTESVNENDELMLDMCVQNKVAVCKKIEERYKQKDFKPNGGWRNYGQSAKGLHLLGCAQLANWLWFRTTD